MAQPSVAREPSMEEILASIRRIIENNDVDALKPADSGFVSAFPSDRYDEDDSESVDSEDAEDIHLTIEDDLPSFAPEPVSAESRDVSRAAPALPEAEATSARQSAASPEPAPRAPEPAPRPVETRGLETRPVETRAVAQDLRAAVQEEARAISLADVAARVRAASERTPVEQPRHVAANQGSGRSVELRPAPAQRPVEASVRPGSDAPAAAPQRDDRDRQIEIRPAVTATEPRGVPVAENQPVRAVETETVAPVQQRADDVRPIAIVEQPVQQADEPVDESKALVSASTGDQVARSFQELAALVNNTPQRSLDEVAEELLRPMLQEWLDDNLPTLVERLVREEIERVARGPRR